VLFHVSRLSESIAHFERALAINPDDEVASMHLGFALYLQGAFQVAFDLSDEARRRSASAWVFYQVALAEIQLGRRDDAERTVNAAARQFPGHVLFYPLRGLLAALRGDAEGALELVQLTIRHARSFGHYHHAQYDVACIHATLGQTDAALRWLTDSATNGFPCAAFFERDPLLASIREDPRFTALMRTLHDECARYGELYRTLHTSSIA
jgi:tetratricopeptide (TPR) repeat protein